jgi:hypothetical protein
MEFINAPIRITILLVTYLILLVIEVNVWMVV